LVKSRSSTTSWRGPRRGKRAIIDKKTEDHGMLAITSIYVKFLLPMMIEVQWWDYKQQGANA
jgi:hypothetical protein